MIFRELHNVILDSVNEGVFTVNRDWRITEFNRAAEKITGVSREEAIGSPCREVFRATICEDACALKRTMETGNPVVNTTAYIINAKGNRIPIRISTALLRSEDSGLIGGVETFSDLTQVEQLQKELESRYTFEDIIGRSRSMMDLFRVLPQIAESDSTVLIEGASGTGKELFAQAIHNLSLRSEGPFVPVNCSALPDTLLESELFGYRAGAFTGANKDKPGRFAVADGGTIFLDEIGNISPAMQVRLLRVLQEREIEPLGATKPEKIDVRIVSATNADLARLMEEDSFREDLFYRIRVIHLKLPELCNRREDIPLLIDHMIAKLNNLRGKNIAGVSGEVMACLMEYDYPGNVRELENIIEHAFVLCRSGMIELQHLPSAIARPSSRTESGPGRPMTLAAMERIMIADALRRQKGNRSRTAAELGIDTSTLFRKIKSLKIDTPATDGRSMDSREN